ncbi:hypothetical protein THAOC_09948 [Thalassiosira oceanica]|uniref:Uncharacterized protein n=1 Tax=Thalassiosira oceanica TaxID=159749 RepID=K0TE44_THAOC|nr:hypothetical protein THAOC_09948 [Thalassiosira oceanica]|mmetsp:Transcript_34811/g.83244  ORF Transcript_34811/g.83244 Transcript_34811/m.83244 type:complete len:213 (-) Transcript_34811:57-695(-)|eukprot:EJK68837.1 hypothetical protein THAOC_09948 [Thalassiosira oceanica]
MSTSASSAACVLPRRRLELIILISCCALVCPCTGFCVATPKSCTRSGPDSNSSTSLEASSRRSFISQSVLSITAVAAPSQPARAKDEQVVTQQTVTDAFDAIRFELNDPKGVVSTLSNLIDGGSFEEILQYTKESDAYFRKAKMGRARKLLTDKDLKGDAVSMSNAVTFDLIGINRSSRPGKENREEQLKYLGELKMDIERFLELEKTIVMN